MSPSPAARRLYRALYALRPHHLGSAAKRLARVRRFPYRAANGLVYMVDPVSNLGQFLLGGGEYEPSVSRVIECLLPPKGVFVDIGANEGYFAILACRHVGPHGRVIAVEPQARLQGVLEANANLNALQNLTVLQFAIASEGKQSMRLELASDLNTGASGARRIWKLPFGSEVVPCRTLGKLLDEQDVGQVDLVKIDCEGGEASILQSNPQALRPARIANLLVEYHPHILGASECEKLDALLTERGYSVRQHGFHGLYLGSEDEASANIPPEFEPVSNWRADKCSRG